MTMVMLFAIGINKKLNKRRDMRVQLCVDMTAFAGDIQQEHRATHVRADHVRQTFRHHLL